MTMINKEETISKLTAEVKDIEAEIAQMENIPFDINNPAGFQSEAYYQQHHYLMGKRITMYKAIALVDNS